MKIVSAWEMIALALVIIGGINWGLIGLFGIDLVSLLLGWAPALQSLIYILVGIAAVIVAYAAFRGDGRTWAPARRGQPARS